MINNNPRQLVNQQTHNIITIGSKITCKIK